MGQCHRDKILTLQVEDSSSKLGHTLKKVVEVGSSSTVVVAPVVVGTRRRWGSMAAVTVVAGSSLR